MSGEMSYRSLKTRGAEENDVLQSTCEWCGDCLEQIKGDKIT